MLATVIPICLLSILFLFFVTLCLIDVPVKAIHRHISDTCGEQIDIVVTWAGPHTQQRSEDCKKYGIPNNRVHGTKEIQVLLKSVKKYTPALIKRIFVVVSGEVNEDCIPSFLRDNQLVVVVTHQEILPHESLPCFNSFMIESCLHKIPDLSEHFIYANDDFFFAQNTDISDWVNEGGQYFFDTIGCPKSLVKGKSAYNSSIRNVQMLLGPGKVYLLSHTPCMLSKTGFKRVETKYPWLIERQSHSQVRSSENYHIVMLVANLDYLENRCLVRDNKGCDFFTVKSNFVLNRLTRNWDVLVRRNWTNTRLGCVNDERQYPEQHEKWIDKCFYKPWDLCLNTE